MKKLVPGRGIGISFSDAAFAKLVEAGYDPVYGARPLKRAIQTLVENPLARRILDGEFAHGDEVHVDAKDGALTFMRAGVEPAADS